MDICALTSMLEQVINVGNWRYNDGEYSVRLFNEYDLTKVLKNDDSPFQPDTVSESMFSFKSGFTKKQSKKPKKQSKG